MKTEILERHILIHVPKPKEGSKEEDLKKYSLKKSLTKEKIQELISYKRIWHAHEAVQSKHGRAKPLFCAKCKKWYVQRSLQNNPHKSAPLEKEPPSNKRPLE